MPRAASEIVSCLGTPSIRALGLEVRTGRDVALAVALAVAPLASAVDRAIGISSVRTVPAHVSSSGVLAVFPSIVLPLMSDASVVFSKQTSAFSAAMVAASLLVAFLFAARSCSSFSARLAAALSNRLRINAFGVPPSQAPVDSSLGWQSSNWGIRERA